MDKPRRVMIGTPSYDGTVGVHFAAALAETVRLGMQHGVAIYPMFRAYDALIQRARNDLVLDALQHQCDDLIFIDGDQEWKPEWVMQLLSHSADCVGGAVRKKSDDESYNVKANPVLLANVWPMPHIIAVDGLGTGFLRLSRKAMEALWHASEEYRDDSGKTNRLMFDVRVVDGRYVGEDIFMTQKLRAAGIPVYLDPTITCSHIGAKKWDGDFMAWLKRLQLQGV